MFRKTLLVLAVIGLLLSACGPAAPSGPTTYTDGMGRQVTVTVPVQKIISLAPSATEVLFAVGAGTQVVGRDTFSDYPAEAAAVADIGGGFGALNTELILSLEPDLVVAAMITPPEQIQTLEQAGLTVFVLPNPKSFEDLYALLTTAGELTGHTEEVAELNKGLEARVKAVQEKIAPLSYAPVVFYELDATDPNAPYTSGPGTFVNMVINAAGGINMGSSLEGEWVQVSVEQLLTENPNFILLGDSVWGGVTAETVAARPGWDGLSAVKEGNVLPFDDNLVSRPGPRLVDGLEAMAKLLHPDVFK